MIELPQGEDQLAAHYAATSDAAAAAAFLNDEACTDAIRAGVARRTDEADRRRAAIAAIKDEAALVELALTAEHADTRMTAAERVRSPDALRKLADMAADKDRGVARLARKRFDAIVERDRRGAQADAILAELEALADKPGPIVTAVIDLDRRWEALHLTGDPERRNRCEAARRRLQERFEREHEAQRSRARFEHGLRDWLANADPPATSEALSARLAELATLRADAGRFADANARAQLDEAEQRIEKWTQELNALAAAEALVVEAEQLAAGTSIDNAKLPERWEALDRRIRTPALTRRFEAALITIEQRRLAQIHAAQQEASAARQHVHNLLHAAEQALAAGQLQPARTAVDEIRARKGEVASLPKPTMQRLGRVVQQLTELERWESFGQQQARVQLCERAEALAAATLDPKRLAVEVQNLRNEWKALDAQHAGVPRSLWERFDRACEKAYAPAARHFAELAAKRKEARKSREEFIDAAAAHAPTLLAEPRDLRAIERWLRETERQWREGDLGSLDPKAWKSFDAKFRAALAPGRDALGAAREEAKAKRVALIEEATALAAKAMERDAPSQVKALQARWQAQAKEVTLPQRDELALWEQFRTACNAVFDAREAKRKAEDDKKHAGRRALEEICAALEALAQAADSDEAALRRGLRDAQDRWRQATRRPNEAPRGLESRFTNAKAAAEAVLAARSRAKVAAVWQAVAAKELLCERLDRQVVDATGTAETAAGATEEWKALAGLPAPWEKALLARRDAAVAAFEDEEAADAHRAKIDEGAQPRAELLLDLEMKLGLPIPPELQALRLALQVKKLRDRFKSESTGAGTPEEAFVAWCATPGVADGRDRERIERARAKLEGRT